MLGAAKDRVVSLFSSGNTVTSAQRQEPWFGPGQIMPAMAPPADVAGRAFDYPVSFNTRLQPRTYEGTSFDSLRNLADAHNLVRLCIETRKDQMSKLTFSVVPRKMQGETMAGTPDARCQKIEDFLRRPDGRHGWADWQRLLLEELFVVDAPTVYVRRTKGGDVFSLDIMDGATVAPKLDITGRTPEPPAVAFQQVLKGLPAINYTSDELLYKPRNPRVNKLYGFSPVEQIIFTINIALRREVTKLSYFTEGNVPDALVGVPKDWSPQTIAEFQRIWDAMMSDPNSRRKMYFVPGDMNFQQSRSDDALMEAVDEWFARVICYCFSLPPLPFVKQQNRATAESAADAAIDEGLMPLMVWFKAFMDDIVQRVFGYDDLEILWDDVKKVDPNQQAQLDLELIKAGVKSLDEVRAPMGLPPTGLGPVLFGVGPMGAMLVSDFIKASTQGLMMPPAAPPPDAMGAPGMQPPLAGPGMPSPAIQVPHSPSPSGVHADLSGISPKVLAAVGLGGGSTQGRRLDITSRDVKTSDPLSGAAAHPGVLKTLRMAEAKHRRQAGGR